MARGEGGGGHFDERRRAAGKADSPEVLAAVQKPKKSVTKKAPTVVVKKKKLAPSRVKTDSNSGEPSDTGTKMTVTRYNTGRLKPQNTGFVSPAREPTIRPQNTGFVTPPRAPPNIIPQNYGFANPEDDYSGNLRQGALEAELRAQRPLSSKGDREDGSILDIGHYDPGGNLYGEGLKLLDWVKRRNTVRGPRNI